MILNDKQILDNITMINQSVPTKIEKGAIIKGTTIKYSYGIDPQGYTFRLADESIEQREAIIIDPLTSVRLISYENFNLPNDVCAFLYGKSSYTRVGLIFSFAVVDAGYSGNIGFSVFNGSKVPRFLLVGQGIVQIVFHKIEHPELGYRGAWQNFSTLGDK